METQPKIFSVSATNNGKAPSISEYFPPSDETNTDGNWSVPQLLSLLRRRAALMVGVAVITTAAISASTLNQKPSYTGTFQLLVEPVTAQNIDQLAQNNGNQITQSTTLDYPTQIQVLLSPKLMEPIIKKIQARYSDVGYDLLSKNLSIERPEDTKILVITYQETDAEKLKFILDQLAQGYLKYSQQERQSNLRQGIQFVNNQILQTQRRVDSLQRQLQSFRQQNNFVNPDTQVSQVAGQTSGLAQQRTITERELTELQKTYSNLQGRSGATAALANDSSYQGFLAQLRDLDSKIAVESARFQNDNPAVTALQDQRESLLPILRQEARRVLGNKLADADTQLSILETRLQAIASAERQLEQQGQRLPVIARLYADLQRELTVATESLNRFLQTRENLQVGAAQKEVPWQLIASPEVPQTSTDSQSRNILLGAITGLFLGISTALLADKLDNTIRTANDLKKQTSLPLLGTVPYNAELQNNEIVSLIPRLLQIERLKQTFKSRRKTRSYTDQAFSESFRSLRTNIRLLSSDTPIRSIVVSSARPGEGKSTVSMHLAQAAAAMGQRVLLVDADLRNPHISQLLDLPNETGLSDLIQTDLHPEQVIRLVHEASSGLVTQSSQPKSLLQASLSVIASGKIEVDPTRLLSSPKMRQLIEYFQNAFDLVIYDTPPLLMLADSSLLATHTDGMILVAGLGKTDRVSLTETLESLKTTRIPVWGVVANAGVSKS